MDYVPHVSEIFLIVAVIFVIFGLGRLPHMSVALAKVMGGAADDKGPQQPDDDAKGDA